MSQAQRCLGRWFPAGELPIALEEVSTRSPWGPRTFAESPLAQWGATATESLGASMVTLTQAPAWKLRGGDGHSTARTSHAPHARSPRSQLPLQRSLSPEPVERAQFAADDGFIVGVPGNAGSHHHLCRAPPHLPTRQRHWSTILPRETSMGQQRQDHVQAFFVTCTPCVSKLEDDYDTRQGLPQGAAACDFLPPEQPGGDQGDAPLLTPRTDTALPFQECVSVNLDDVAEAGLSSGSRSAATQQEGRIDHTSQWFYPL
mmetsp:Transcript_43290/g.114054  ORF Transcript_43290/g.114054 Transcript_43290/m.114054 type:complete len:259 (-) Transcript_43290:2-778(-)